MVCQCTDEAPRDRVGCSSVCGTWGQCADTNVGLYVSTTGKVQSISTNKKYCNV